MVVVEVVPDLGPGIIEGPAYRLERLRTQAGPGEERSGSHGLYSLHRRITTVYSTSCCRPPVTSYDLCRLLASAPPRRMGGRLRIDDSLHHDAAAVGCLNEE